MGVNVISADAIRLNGSGGPPVPNLFSDLDMTIEANPTDPTAGTIRFRSPMNLNEDYTAIDQVGFRHAPTITLTSNFIGGFLNSSPTYNIQTGVFVSSMLTEQGIYNQQAAAGFAAYTKDNVLPQFIAAGAFAPVNQLYLNIGSVTWNQSTGGTRTTATVTGMNFAPQLRASGAAGSRMNLTNTTALSVGPTFSTTAGTTVAWTNIRAVHMRNIVAGFLQPGAGAELLTGVYVGLDVDNITFGTGAKIAVRSALANVGSNRFLQNDGTAISTFAGLIRMNDGVNIQWGTSNGVQIQRVGASRIQLSDYAGITNNTWDFSNANSSVIGGTEAIQINTPFISLGTSLPGASNGWFLNIAAPAQSVGGGVDFANCLNSPGGIVNFTALRTNFAQWTVNAPSSSGTAPTHAANMIVQTSVGHGVNRYGIRLTANPGEGGGGRGAALEVTTGRTYLDGEVIQTPLQLVTFVAGNINDWTGWQGRSVMDVQANGLGTTITGMAGPHEGQYLEIYNRAGGGNLTLAHLSGLSVAANQFDFVGGAGIVLLPDEMIRVRYINGKWRDFV